MDSPLVLHTVDKIGMVLLRDSSTHRCIATDERIPEGRPRVVFILPDESDCTRALSIGAVDDLHRALDRRIDTDTSFPGKIRAEQRGRNYEYRNERCHICNERIERGELALTAELTILGETLMTDCLAHGTCADGLMHIIEKTWSRPEAIIGDLV